MKAPDPAIAGDNFEYHGHTIALIDFKNGGSIGIDPTYGFILISKEKLYDGAIKSGHFELFSLFDKPADNDGPLTPLKGLEVYARAATAVEADVERGGDRLTVWTPRLLIPPVKSLVIGKRDGTNKEVGDAFGGWVGHVGYWYEKSRHIWRFRVPSPGTYEVIFYLEGGDASVVLKRGLDIDISGSGITSIEDNNGLGAQGTLRVVVNASKDFNIAFTSNSVSARLVDAIQARKITRFNNVLYAVFGRAP